jgi:hypothetical protein
VAAAHYGRGRDHDQPKGRRIMTDTVNTTTDPANGLAELAERYIATWNETVPAARRHLVGQLWAAEVRYVDPLAAVTGPDAIDAMLGAVQEQFPGLRFRLAGPVDAHHDQARFTWELTAEDGDEPVAVGFDVIERDADGRLALVLGFLDQVPASG